MPRYAAFLRAISNVEMQPVRQAMEDLGFTDVESYGMSGNLLFTAHGSDRTPLEGRIAERLGTVALVRTRPELARVVAKDPFRANIMLLAHPAPAPRRQAFLALAFEEPRPVLQGTTLFFVYPARLRGKRTPFDFEHALGTSGTARSARVVDRLLARMSQSPSKG